MTRDSILICADEQEIFNEEYAALQHHPRVRQGVYEKALELLNATKAKESKFKKVFKRNGRGANLRLPGSRCRLSMESIHDSI